MSDLPLPSWPHSFLCLDAPPPPLPPNWVTQLHLSCLQVWLQFIYSPSHHSMDFTMTVPTTVLSFLHWWTDPCHVCMAIFFLPASRDKMIIINASLVGCGTHMDDHVTHRMVDSLMHRNILELGAVRRACQSFLLFSCSHHILIMSDKATTIFCISKQVGTRSALCEEVVNLCNWCLHHQVLLSTGLYSWDRMFS